MCFVFACVYRRGDRRREGRGGRPRFFFSVAGGGGKCFFFWLRAGGGDGDLLSCSGWIGEGD